MKHRKIELNDQERIDLKNKLLNRSKFNENNQCLEWKEGKAAKGYGTICFKKVILLTHRAAWIVFNGDIQDDMVVCHKCDNPPCINVDHLFLGTQKENMNDMILKGRLKRSEKNRILPKSIKRQQLAFNINIDLHQRVKALAATRNISMSLWIMRALQECISKESHLLFAQGIQQRMAKETELKE